MTRIPCPYREAHAAVVAEESRAAAAAHAAEDTAAATERATRQNLRHEQDEAYRAALAADAVSPKP